MTRSLARSTERLRCIPVMEQLCSRLKEAVEEQTKAEAARAQLWAECREEQQKASWALAESYDGRVKALTTSINALTAEQEAIKQEIRSKQSAGDDVLINQMFLEWPKCWKQGYYVSTDETARVVFDKMNAYHKQFAPSKALIKCAAPSNLCLPACDREHLQPCDAVAGHYDKEDFGFIQAPQHIIKIVCSRGGVHNLKYRLVILFRMFE